MTEPLQRGLTHASSLQRGQFGCVCRRSWKARVGSVWESVWAEVEGSRIPQGQLAVSFSVPCVWDLGTWGLYSPWNVFEVFRVWHGHRILLVLPHFYSAFFTSHNHSNLSYMQYMYFISSYLPMPAMTTHPLCAATTAGVHLGHN